ncbi:hypothetical protein D049_1483A, partial [Vibrio parahaemolyticus VPTS-2010]
MLNTFIHLHHNPSAQWAHDHCANKHWYVSPNNHAHRTDSPRYRAAFFTNNLTTGVTNQKWQQVSDHWPHE